MVTVWSRPVSTVFPRRPCCYGASRAGNTRAAPGAGARQCGTGARMPRDRAGPQPPSTWAQPHARRVTRHSTGRGRRRSITSRCSLHHRPPLSVRSRTTTGPMVVRDGALQLAGSSVDHDTDIPLAYALGHRNVEQYVGPLEPGKLQALPLAFDVQRGEWFDLFAGESAHAGGLGPLDESRDDGERPVPVLPHHRLRQGLSACERHVRHPLGRDGRGMRSLSWSRIGARGGAHERGKGSVGRARPRIDARRLRELPQPARPAGAVDAGDVVPRRLRARALRYRRLLPGWTGARGALRARLVPVEPHVRRGRALLELSRRPRRRHAEAGKPDVPDVSRPALRGRDAHASSGGEHGSPVHRVSHAGHGLHAARSASRPLLQASRPRADRGAGRAERLQPVSHRS